MARFFLWLGIIVIVVGWGGLGWEAAKYLNRKNEEEKIDEKKKASLLRRNYCRFAIIIGLALIIISLLI